MTITLTLKPEVEASLRRKAAAEGQPLNAYLESAIEHLAQSEEIEDSPLWATATNQEWDKAFVTWVESHEQMPVLPPEAFTREGLYGERG